MTDVIAHNQEILNQLLWAVEMAEPHSFTLLFAECDSLALRSRLVEQFKAQSQLTVTEIMLPPTVRVPYHHLRGVLGDTVPDVLFVYGLEAVNELAVVLQAFNNSRDLFAEHLPFPIVFWLTSDVSHPQSRIAKDWDSWGRTLAFAVDVAEQRDWLIAMSDRAVERGLAAGAAPYKHAIEAIVGERGDVERAWAAVQAQNLNLAAPVAARIMLLRGLIRRDPETTPTLYQQSLELWARCEPSATVQCQEALTRFYFGMWWLGAAKFNRMEKRQAYNTARELWETAIALWTEADRLDIVAGFINPLGAVYQRLGAWPELAALTARSQALHQTYPNTIWQAHDLGVLAAEGAIQRQDWAAVQALTTEALTLLETVSPDAPAYKWTQRFHRGWYLLNRAIARWHQEQAEGAIADLEAARQQTRAKSDPYLYFRILETLRGYHFERKDYLAAFTIKQHQQAVEFEFGFRAFVGAGRLQSRQQTQDQSETERQRWVTEEINASGREQDIQQLLKRVKESRHRLTIIYGASGVGKSSLIRAALLPTLRQETVATRLIVPAIQTVYTHWQGSLASCIATAFDWLTFPTQHLFNESSPVAQAQTVEAVLQQLRVNEGNNLLTVLIFDQFEEFLLAHPNLRDRLPFYQFLREAMNIPAVKVIFAMRSDYLHYLLECNDPAIVDLDVVNHDILGRDVLYYLGKFSPQQARDVVEQLTGQARFRLQPDLVEALIAELTEPGGKIRPIELQIVGAQLQSEQVATLADYQAQWNKTQLVEKYLTDIVADCGPEQERLAWNVLGLLIDPKREVRPIRSRSELDEQLQPDAAQLDLVLTILHGSRLIFRHQLGADEEERFQLVHDYLVEPIREILGGDLVARLAQAEKEKAVLAEANAVLKTANRRAAVLNRKASRRLRLGTGVLAVILIITGALSLHATHQQFLARQALLKLKDADDKLDISEKNLQKVEKQLVIAEKSLQEVKEEIAVTETALRKARSSQRFESPSSSILRIAQSRQLDALLSAIQTGRKQQKALANGKSKKVGQYGTQANPTFLLNQLLFETHNQTLLSFRSQYSWGGASQPIDISKNGRFLTIPMSNVGSGYSSITPVDLVDVNSKKSTELKEHKRTVWTARFSPDDKYLLTSSDDKTSRIWSIEGEEISVLKGHQLSVHMAEFSPNGKHIVTTSIDNTAKVWSASGKIISNLAHLDEVLSANFSYNNKYVVTTSRDNTAKVWTLEGENVATLRNNTYIWSAKFTPDGEHIVAASNDGSLKIWNFRNNSVKNTSGHKSAVWEVEISPNGNYIATASQDGTAKIWSISGDAISTLRGHKDSVKLVDFSSDGKSLITASDDKTARIWNLEGEEIYRLAGHQKGLNGAILYKDKAITSSYDDTVRVWDFSTQIFKDAQGHQGKINTTQISPSGQMIVTSSSDETAKIWNLKSNKSYVLSEHKGTINTAFFSPDEKYIVTASDDGTAKVWDVKGENISTLKGHEDRVRMAKFNSNSELIVTSSNDNTVRVWNIYGDFISTLDSHEHNVAMVEFSPNGKYILSVSEDYVAKIWSTKGNLLTTIPSVEAAKFSPSGNYIVTIDISSQATVRDTQGRELAVLEGHEYKVAAIEFSPDEKYIVSTSLDRTAKIWSIDGREVITFRNHNGSVIDAGFSPNGETIVTVSSHGVARYWNLSGEELATLWIPGVVLTTAQFSRDGKSIITTSDDYRIRIWPVYTLDQLLTKACDWLHYYLRDNPEKNTTLDSQPLCPNALVSEQ